MAEHAETDDRLERPPIAEIIFEGIALATPEGRKEYEMKVAGLESSLVDTIRQEGRNSIVKSVTGK